MLDSGYQLQQYAPVIKVTGAYMVLFYIFMVFQSFAKFYIYFKTKSNKKSDEKVSLKKIKYASTSGLGFVSDRTFMNLLEQSPMFLTALWMHAVFVSIETAANAGWLYIAFRLIYPLVFSMGPPWIFISTVPNYCVVWYLAGATVYASCNTVAP
eukprot:gene11332-13392_t